MHVLVGRNQFEIIVYLVFIISFTYARAQNPVSNNDTDIYRTSIIRVRMQIAIVSRAFM